ncbi:hypothetical protein DdX_18436 [Ditylenchus destructor]|uniref:Uncharacterized protein n=1 Tax=Ditylenchus destructor TaxID=166010 RepID=A0AAD4MPJ2_9BILA|nr:hypothetical protein DdX_18436 [Ditylenchus destructor]
MSSLKDAGLMLDDELDSEEDNFILAMVNCSTLSRVDGLYDSFNICRPKGHNAVEERHFAYFIGGRFDPVFIDNFVRQTAHNIKIRIFTEASNKSALHKVDLIEEYKRNIHFGPLSTHNTGFADVKNIIDLREDNNRLEIMKYDLTYTDVEPIIMSITTPVPICQLLVVLRDKSVAQVARLIKSLNSALYYIYAANKSAHKRNVYYLSFMRFSCAPYYELYLIQEGKTRGLRREIFWISGSHIFRKPPMFPARPVPIVLAHREEAIGISHARI